MKHVSTKTPPQWGFQAFIRGKRGKIAGQKTGEGKKLNARDQRAEVLECHLAFSEEGEEPTPSKTQSPGRNKGQKKKARGATAEKGPVIKKKKRAGSRTEKKICCPERGKIRKKREKIRPTQKKKYGQEKPSEQKKTQYQPQSAPRRQLNPNKMSQGSNASPPENERKRVGKEKKKEKKVSCDLWKPGGDKKKKGGTQYTTPKGQDQGKPKKRRAD